MTSEVERDTAKLLAETDQLEAACMETLEDARQNLLEIRDMRRQLEHDLKSARAARNVSL